MPDLPDLEHPGPDPETTPPPTPEFRPPRLEETLSVYREDQEHPQTRNPEQAVLEQADDARNGRDEPDRLIGKEER